MVVHVVPFADCEAVSTVPRRSKRTQYGDATAVPVVLVRLAPVVRRWWNALPDVLLRNIMPMMELAARDSRTITPALLHGWMF
jgi:hypothetical protein